MQKKQLPPVSMVKEDISEFYAITTDIFHVHHLYVTQKVNSKKKVVGFLSFKTQPNLMVRNFKVVAERRASSFSMEKQYAEYRISNKEC